jgi:hypothetical protein
LAIAFLNELKFLGYFKGPEMPNILRAEIFWVHKDVWGLFFSAKI